MTFEYDKSKSEKDVLRYDPIKSRKRKRFISSTFTQMLIASTFALPLLLKVNGWALFLFILLTTGSYILTFLIDYLLGTRDTKTIYKSSLKRRLELLKKMNTYEPKNNDKKVLTPPKNKHEGELIQKEKDQ